MPGFSDFVETVKEPDNMTGFYEPSDVAYLSANSQHQTYDAS